MSRLVDDIVHYFGRHDIDILKAEARMALLRDNWDMIRSLTSVQSHAELSGSLELALADALLTAEDSDRRIARRMPEFDGTIKQFCQITRELYPNCRICWGDDDQIVIYTGATMEMGGEVVAWEPEDEDDYQAWCDRHPEVA